MRRGCARATCRVDIQAGSRQRIGVGSRVESDVRQRISGVRIDKRLTTALRSPPMSRRQKPPPHVPAACVTCNRPMPSPRPERLPGRPAKYEHLYDKALVFLAEGKSTRWIAAQLGCDHNVVGRWRARAVEDGMLEPVYEPARAVGRSRDFPPAARLIELVGADQAALRTHAATLVRVLGGLRGDVALVSEPSGREVGRMAIASLAEAGDAGRERAALLLAADRLEVYAQDVAPTLNAGGAVVVARYLPDALIETRADLTPGVPLPTVSVDLRKLVGSPVQVDGWVWDEVAVVLSRYGDRVRAAV